MFTLSGIVLGTPIEKRVARPGPENSFLYDIVCNQWNGLDMDRIDYMQV